MSSSENKVHAAALVDWDEEVFVELCTNTSKTETARTLLRKRFPESLDEIDALETFEQLYDWAWNNDCQLKVDETEN